MINSDVLKEIFVRHDLDNNGAISRSEFDFFHEKTNHEICDDSSWKVLQGSDIDTINIQ